MLTALHKDVTIEVLRKALVDGGVPEFTIESFERKYDWNSVSLYYPFEYHESVKASLRGLGCMSYKKP